MAVLDGLARRYGTRPSTLVGLDPEEALALEFDMTAAKHGVLEEKAGTGGAGTPGWVKYR